MHRDNATYVETTDTYYADHLDLENFELVYAEDMREYIHIDDAIQDIEGEWQHVDDVSQYGEKDGESMYILERMVRHGYYVRQLVYLFQDEVLYHKDSDEYADWVEDNEHEELLEAA